MQCARLIRKESADVVIVIESLERKKTCLSSLHTARLLGGRYKDVVNMLREGTKENIHMDKYIGQ